jgi:hypothetical protein
VAAPPTTDAPSGPAAAGPVPSASKVVIASSRQWRMGAISVVALTGTY